MGLKPEKFIRKVEEVLDPERVEEAMKRQTAAWNFKPVDYPPLIVNCPPPDWWPNFMYKEAFYDKEKMLISQLGPVYQHCKLQDDFVPCIRADYGVVVVPSSFGSEICVPENIHVFEKTYTIGPWVKNLILDKDPPSIRNLRVPDPRKDGLMKTVLETEEYFIKKLEGTGIRTCLMFLLAPLTNAFSLRGNKLITDFWKHPDFVDDLLEILSDVYIEFSKIQKEIINEPLTQGVQKGVGDGIWMAEGGVRYADDIVILLSPRLYNRFCKHINEKTLKPFKGGIFHTCGDVKPLLEDIVSTKGIKAINLGNPDMYSLKELIDICHGKACIIWCGHPREGQPVQEWIKEVAECLGDERTGIILSLYEGATTFEEAQKLVENWKNYFLR